MQRRKLFGSWWRRTIGRVLHKNQPPEWTPTQRSFIAWNAERLGISAAESEARFRQSWCAIAHGHRGREFREFNKLSYEVYQVFAQDREQEVFESYRLHAPMHFLRMLSYSEHRFDAEHPVVRALDGIPEVTVLDFGCGLAHQSRALCEYLLSKNRRVRLVLIDIPTLRREFLLWAGAQRGIPTEFLACTREQPIPALPPAHVCIATDFFEHVHDPVRYFDRIDQALVPGAILIADTEDHEAEHLHVSPQLGALRQRLAEREYAVIRADECYRKAGSPQTGTLAAAVNGP